MDPVSINIFEQINQICKEFRRECRGGSGPDIADWLQRVPESSRPNLLQNLLDIEVNYRRSCGIDSSSDEYVKRFPQFASLIRQAFFEDTMLSMVHPLEDTPAIDSADFAKPSNSFDSLEHHSAAYVPMEMPAARRIGEYELLRELGRGGMGVVYEARHLQRQNHVALKTLPTGVDGQEINAERLHKFRNEFRSLAEINHPNLVGMQSLEVDGNQWFFTMDVVDGTDFLSFVRPNEQLDEARLRTCLRQMATGIAYLHRNGIVHRDLKPSNVLVDESNRVVILDFGLVAQLQTGADITASKTGLFAGTPRYAAPEQLHGKRTAATDWYAVGTMLFEALTGRPPFTGTPMAVLNQKQNEDPPCLSNEPSLAKDLAGLADGLLMRVPEQRATTVQVMDALGLGPELNSHELSESSSAPNELMDEQPLEMQAFSEESILLVGREEQLDQLEHAKREFVDTQKPVVVWITGKSGEGKSSLAEKFLRPIRHGNQMLVLSGRCYERESVPFKGVDCLVESLVSTLRSKTDNEVGNLLPKDTHFLARLFPALRRVNAIDHMRKSRLIDVDESQVRFRAFAALKAILRNISEQTPVVLFVDDLQWGDLESAQILYELLSSGDEPLVLFIGSYRADEAEASPFLNEWARLQDEFQKLTVAKEVRTTPLNAEQCALMLATRLGVKPEFFETQITELCENTAGSPYFLEQLADGYDDQANTFEIVPIVETISRRINRCPPDAQRLLDLIAAYGQPIPVSELVELADDSSKAIGVLTRMCNERLVRLSIVGEQQTADTYHDRIRESTLERLADDQKCELHLFLGESLERALKIDHLKHEEILSSGSAETVVQENAGQRLSDLAFLFTQAKHPKAFVYSLLAGELFARAYAVENAVEHFERAKKLLPQDVSPTSRFRLSERMGWSMLRSYRVEEAIVHYHDASKFATNGTQKGIAFFGMAHSELWLGNCSNAISVAENALAAVGYRSLPQNKFAVFLDIIYSAVCVLVLPKTHQRIDDQEDAKRAKLVAETFDVVNYAESEKSAIRCVACHLRRSRYAINCADGRLTQVSYSNLSFILAAVGFVRMARFFLEKSRSIQTFLESDDEESEGMRYFNSAFLKSAEGRPKAALSDHYLAATMFEKCVNSNMGSRNLEVTRHIEALTCSPANELATAHRQLSQAVQSNFKAGMCWGHFGAANAHARAGNLKDAHDHMRKAGPLALYEKLVLTESAYRTAYAYVWLQSSNFQKAETEANRAWMIATKEDNYWVYSVQSLPLLIEAMIGSAWSDSRTIASERRMKIRQLLRKTWFAWRAFPLWRCLIERSRGRAYLALGNRKRGIRYLQKSVEWARRLETNYDLARCLLDLAAVKEESRKENRAAAIDLLKEIESVIPRAESWLLGDQYDESVVAPEFDVQAWDAEKGNMAENDS